MGKKFRCVARRENHYVATHLFLQIRQWEALTSNFYQ